jgi:hypothetical protein
LKMRLKIQGGVCGLAARGLLGASGRALGRFRRRGETIQPHRHFLIASRRIECR